MGRAESVREAVAQAVKITVVVWMATMLLYNVGFGGWFLYGTILHFRWPKPREVVGIGITTDTQNESDAKNGPGDVVVVIIGAIIILVAVSVFTFVMLFVGGGL